MKKKNDFTFKKLTILFISMFLILSTASCEINQFLDLFNNQGNNNTNDDNNDIVNNPDYCYTSICPASTSISLGDTAPLDITGVDPNARRISWSVKDGPGGGTWNPSGQDQVIENFTPDSVGMYYMTVRYYLYGGEFICTCDFTIEVIGEPENEPCNDTFVVDMSETAVPVDIVMVIDNSASMKEEIDAVRSFINKLSNQMENSAVDYHFIMISKKNGNINGSTYGIKVPPPLGTSSRFMHLDVKVNSWAALRMIIINYDDYAFFLRDDAILNFIIITDDNSSMEFYTFKNKMKALGKPIFKMHGIIGLKNGSSNIINVGEEYITGIQETGGVKLNINTPISNWGSLFDQISNNIIEQAAHDYSLTNKPIIHDQNFPENSFKVYINGQGIISNNNWVYNQAKNSITFLNMELLKDNDNINVKYEMIGGTSKI